MVSISYGGYSFPHPLPFVSKTNNPVFLSGSLDHSFVNLSLIGQLTGCRYTDLKVAKDEIVHALSSGYKNLTIGGTGYEYAKPISIQFGNSNLNRILPYEISFEAYQDSDFSNFFGISSPIDRWQFDEAGDRLVAATHDVSAVGIKVSTGDPLVSARNFVNSRLNGFDSDISLFFSGQTFILKQKNEEINRVNNSYSVSEVYDLSTSVNSYDTETSIVRVQSSLSYDSESNLRVSVNGTIEGGISGFVDSGQFTPDQATEFARNSALRAKVDEEELLYGEILKGPNSYQYDFDTGSNSIAFSFDFSDPTDYRTGDVIHDYSLSFSASKDENSVEGSINGVVKYDSINDIFLTEVPEDEERYQKVEAFFSGISPFSILQQNYLYFNSDSVNYNKNPLNDSFAKLDINKNPFESSIDYTYTANNKLDFFSGMFENVDLKIETEHPITTYFAEQTTDSSFAVQSTHDTLERRTITFNGQLASNADLISGINIAENYISQYSGDSSYLLTDDISTGLRNVSITKKYVLE